MIASVTEQQAASVNSGSGSAISAGGMNNENEVPKNLNGSSNNQSFGQSNGMRNGDSFEFEKFKVRVNSCKYSCSNIFLEHQYCKLAITDVYTETGGMDKMRKRLFNRSHSCFDRS